MAEWERQPMPPDRSASLGLDIAYSLTVITQLLFISYTSKRGASNGFTTGASMAAAGATFAAGAAVIGAIAFYVSQRRQRENRIGWLSERDARLASAITVFMFAFLLMGLGAFFQTATARGLDASATAQSVLTGMSSLGTRWQAYARPLVLRSRDNRVPRIRSVQSTFKHNSLHAPRADLPSMHNRATDLRWGGRRSASDDNWSL
jgi:hypothetical protein